MTTVALTAGSESYTVRAPVNVVYALDGNDIVNVDPLNNVSVTLDGGLGNDTLFGYDQNDVVDGGAGNDCILGGNNGFDLMFGGDGNDTIEAQRDNDTVFGGRGADSINGDFGDDLIFADYGPDTVNGSGGNDSIYSGLFDGIAAFGSIGNDQLATGNGADYIDGQQDADTIFSGLGNDTLRGGDGVDALGGYFGIDTYYGDGGGDFFNLTFDVRAAEYDLIMDFAAGDFLLLPFWAPTLTAFGEYAGGAYAIVYLGSSFYAVYAAGATAAALQAQTAFV